MGQMMVSIIRERPILELVGAFDIDPNKVGHDVGEVCGGKTADVQVQSPAEDLLRATHADVALHATGSFLHDVHHELRTLVHAGLRTVSTCEELSWPYQRHAQLAAELDSLAKAKGVPLLGSGVNPGFVMDLLPLILTGVCREVRHVSVLRRMDADAKRLGFQKKIGATMTTAQFQAAVATGRFGHIGLPESAWILSDALGWKEAEIAEKLEPVVVDRPFNGRLLKVEAGQVAGLRQECIVRSNGQAVVELRFEAFLGADDPRDEVRIQGTPDVHMRINNGVPGDVATAAVMVNAIPVMMLARPGLLTVKDMVSLHSTRRFA
jgi:4-hydroxy-tetrahydrodipicolinate reductase